ncbi:MAG: TolB family protein [Candidatus Acidiferrales bacterium]
MTERHRTKPSLFRFSGAAATLLVLMFNAGAAFAQEKPRMQFDEDVGAFAVSQDNKIACAVPRMKRIKKTVIERDDIWVTSTSGGKRRIVEGDKFMPVPPPSQYVVDSLAWSPDGRRIAMNMTVQVISTEDTSAITGGKQIALIEENGEEIKVAGSKTRFIEDAFNGAWLADGATAVYLSGAGPYKIMRVRPSDGKTTELFEGHTFDAVTWDAARNQAFAVGRNLSISGRLALVQLDLMKETVREISRLDEFFGRLSVSASGKKVGYFENGDTITVVDVANPQKVARVRAGIGRFEFAKDDQRVLLKRGPEEKSGDLVWIGLRDGSFHPILHSLLVHDFRIAPDGESLIVTDPGRRILKVWPVQ